MAIKVKVSTGKGVIRSRREVAGSVQYLVGMKNSKYLGGECRVWYHAEKCTILYSPWQRILKGLSKILSRFWG
jgi:hypothetical protein